MNERDAQRGGASPGLDLRWQWLILLLAFGAIVYLLSPVLMRVVTTTLERTARRNRFSSEGLLHRVRGREKKGSDRTHEKRQREMRVTAPPIYCPHVSDHARVSFAFASEESCGKSFVR